MVDKVDRPDVRRPYEISSPKETREDQHQQQDQKEEMEKRYKKQIEGDQEEWHKFGSRSVIIKSRHIPSKRVSNMLLRALKIHKGMATAQVDIIWIDNRKTIGALIRLKNIEDYLRVKKLTLGDVIPRDLWDTGDEVEIGIPELITASGSFNTNRNELHAKEKKKPASPNIFLKSIGLIDGNTGKVMWGIAAFYLFFIVMILIAIFYELEK